LTLGAPSPITRLAFLQSSVAAAASAAVPLTNLNWAFPGIISAYARELSAPAPFLEHNARLTMPAASVIKVLILLEAARAIEERGWSWAHVLTVRASDVVAGSETFGKAQKDERVPLSALARAMITQSDNTAANVIVDWLGFDRINALAASIGLEATRMRRHFMDFAARSEGIDNTTSARDMGTLLYGIATGTHAGFARVSAADCRHIIGLMLAQEDRESIPAGITRAVSIANKTGELQDVRHDVAIVGVGGSGAYVLTLLSAQITNRTGAFLRLRELAAQIDRDRPAAQEAGAL